MGDDNEIRQLIKRESVSFLEKALKETKGSAKEYDFNAEFAKTKKNRTFVVFGVTLLTILVLGGVAFGVTLIIRAQTAAAPVDIRAFADLNLKDILDTAKRNDNEMELAKREIQKLDNDLRDGLSAADRDLAAMTETIKARNLGSAEETKAINDARAASTARVTQIRATYNSQSAQKKAQIAEIQKRIDKYDSRLMDQAKKQQSVLDNERKVFDIEKQKQKDFYEGRITEIQAARTSDITKLKKQRDDLAASLTARYNPTFSGSRDLGLISTLPSPPQASAPAALSPYLEDQNFMDAGSSVQLDKSLSDLRYLSTRLRATPYINSVPSVLARIEAEALLSIYAYRSALAKATVGLQARDQHIINLDSHIRDLDKQIRDLNAHIDALDNELGRYRWAVSSYAQENREGGYVLDPRDPKFVVVVLNTAASVSAGTAGYIVRGDKAIASIVFILQDGTLRGRVSDLVQGETIMPFDTILVRAAPSAASTSGGGNP